MSQLGTTINIRGDDSGFRKSLKDTENNANATFSRMAVAAKSKFEGALKLKETFSAGVGLIGSALAGFGLVTVFSSIASLADSYNESARMAREEAEREAAARRDIETRVASTMSSLRQQVSGGTLVPKIDAIQKQIAEAQAVVEEKYQKAEKGLDAMGAYVDRLNALNEIERIRQRLVQAARDELAVATERRIMESEIAAMRAAGNTLGADSLAETLRHMQALDAAKEALHNGDMMRYLRLREAEERLHQANKDRMSKEESERQRLAKQQAERDAEALAKAREREEQLRLEAGWMEKSVEAEYLRLTGRDEESKALEREIDHERKLRQIREAEGMSDDQRSRLLAAEERNYALRGNERDDGKVLAGTSGLISAVSQRVSLGGIGSQLARDAAKAAQQRERMLENFRELLNSIKRGVPATYI